MAKQHLTRCELEVMDVVWERNRVTVQEVVNELKRPLAYTTVMTTLKILDEKGVVGRCGKQGRAYIYEPLVMRDSVRRSMTSELKETLFGGSAKSMVLSLIDENKMSKADIDELRNAIASLEREK